MTERPLNSSASVLMTSWYHQRRSRWTSSVVLILHPRNAADRRPTPTSDASPLRVLPEADTAAIQSFPSRSSAWHDSLRPHQTNSETVTLLGAPLYLLRNFLTAPRLMFLLRTSPYISVHQQSRTTSLRWSYSWSSVYHTQYWSRRHQMEPVVTAHAMG